jgi:hypothetical protein
MRSVRMGHYVEKLKELYPDLTEEQIKKTINIGCHNIMNNLKADKDIMIESSRKKVKFVIYKYRLYTDQKAKNEEIRKKRIQRGNAA